MLRLLLLGLFAGRQHACGRPGASTATGFSQKTCLPASMAAFRCMGRKCGGSARSTTSTPLAISFS